MLDGAAAPLAMPWDPNKGGHKQPKKQGLGLLRSIATDAMTLASQNQAPLPSREQLRTLTIHGLYAIASDDSNDVRARAVCWKAILDHTDKVADRDEDYSRLNNAELTAKMLEHAKQLVRESETVTVVPMLMEADEHRSE